MKCHDEQNGYGSHSLYVGAIAKPRRFGGDGSLSPFSIPVHIRKCRLSEVSEEGLANSFRRPGHDFRSAAGKRL